MKARPWLVIVVVLVSLISCAPRARAEQVPFTSDSLSGMKSGTAASMFSFLGTFAPIGTAAGIASTHESGEGLAILAGTGYLFGPSLGHFYSNRPRRALQGIAVRTAAAAGLLGAVAWSMRARRENGQSVLAAAGIGVGLASVCIDIGSAPRSARTHNEAMRQSRLRLSPARIGMAPGIQVETTF